MKHTRPSAPCIAFLVCLLPLGGCFSERSFPMRQNEMVPHESLCSPQSIRGLGARQWAAEVNCRLSKLLPDDGAPPLTTPDLRSASGRPISVQSHFGVSQQDTDDVLLNLSGLQYTAQVVPVVEPRGKFCDWPGFVRIGIPVGRGCVLSAVMAEPIGRDLGDSYIVLGHGLFGRQYGHDQHNVLSALRRMGHHAVGLEFRGHGMTETQQPEFPMTFGLDEARDLIAVSDYLRSHYGAKWVGYFGYSLTSHSGLLASWIDSDRSLRERTDSPLYRDLPGLHPVPAFDAGMLLFSPAINLVEYGDSLDEPRSLIGSPVRAAFQNRAAERLREKGKTRTGSFWMYVRQELERSHWMSEYRSFPDLVADATEMLDFTGPGWSRLRSVRAPVLIVQSADDPVVGTAQAAVDLMAMTDNPNCGLIVLRDGGHAAFAAAEAAYFYNLMQAFFDPATGPGTVTPAATQAAFGIDDARALWVTVETVWHNEKSYGCYLAMVQTLAATVSPQPLVVSVTPYVQELMQELVRPVPAAPEGPVTPIAIREVGKSQR